MTLSSDAVFPVCGGLANLSDASLWKLEIVSHAANPFKALSYKMSARVLKL